MREQRSGQERGQPGPQAEQLPAVKAVAPNGTRAAPVAPYRGNRRKQRLASRARVHQVRGPSQYANSEDPGDHGQHRYRGERAAPISELEREARHAQTDRVAGARAGDQVPHRAAAARALDMVIDERKRGCIGAALAKPRQRMQPEGRPEAVGEQHEGPRARAGRDAGGEVGALGAEMIGDEAHHEQRDEVAEVERRLDQSGFARGKPPRRLRERQHRRVSDEPGGGENPAPGSSLTRRCCRSRRRRVSDEPGGGENPARAERSEPSRGSWKEMPQLGGWVLLSSLTGIRLGPNGRPNFWNRPLIRVPQDPQAPSSARW